MEFGSTGIPGLDSHLGGGIPRGTTVLVVSEPDNALAAFCEQFAGGGVNEGEQLVFFELDRPATLLRKEIASYATNAEAARKATLKIYDGYSPQFGRPSPSPAGADRAGSFATPLMRAELFPTLLREVQSATPNSYRILVESLSTVVNERNESEILDLVRSLNFAGQETGGIQLLTLVKGVHSAIFEAKLRHVVGGVLELGVERKSFGLYPFLYVTKMLHVRDPVRIFPIKETEHGIAIETAKRV
ncbi:MAG: RAD55 family ATPase [Thermoplasmatota archaeon]